jgi:hypothetical protein
MQEYTQAASRILARLEREGVTQTIALPGTRHPQRPLRLHDGGVVGREVSVTALVGEGMLSHKGLRTLGGPPALHAMNAGNPLPALASAARQATPGSLGGTVPASLGGPGFGAATGGGQVTMNVTIQAWDRADLNDAFRTEIIPRLKDALQFNQAGLRTAFRGVRA